MTFYSVIAMSVGPEYFTEAELTYTSTLEPSVLLLLALCVLVLLR